MDEEVPGCTDNIRQAATLRLRSLVKHGCRHYKAITLLTVAIQERDEGLYHHSKRERVPGVSIFIRKHFKALNLSTTCFMRTCEQKADF